MQMLWLKRLQRELLGPVFETGIFAELVKRYGRTSIFYWRTTDKCATYSALVDAAAPYRLTALCGSADKPGFVHPWQL